MASRVSGEPGGVRHEMPMDNVHDCVDLVSDFMIPETEDFVTGLHQRSIPRRVALSVLVFVVLAAIDLNHGT